MSTSTVAPVPLRSTVAPIAPVPLRSTIAPVAPVGSELDNLTTYSYTYAINNNIPVRLVMVIPAHDIDITDENSQLITYRNQSYYFIGLIDLLRHYLSLSVPELVTLIDQLRGYNSLLRADDIILGYLYNALEPYDLTNPNLITPDQEAELTTILTTVNSIRSEIGESEWDSLGAGVAELETWETQLEEGYLRDEYTNQMLNHAKEVLIPLVPIQPRKFPRTNIVYHSNDLVFYPQVVSNPYGNPSSPFENNVEHQKRPVQPYDGPDIFDRIEVSLRIPFVRYNDSLGQSTYKVYSGRDGIMDSYGEQNPLNYQHILPNSNDTSTPDHLYLIIYLGDDDQSINDANRELIQLITYNLRDNTLKVRIPVRDNLQDDVILRLGLAMKGVSLGPVTRTNISGEFIIWNLEFDEPSILYAILNYDAFRLRFYAEERARPMAIKKRVDLKYHNLAIESIAKDLELTIHNRVTIDASDQFFPEHNQVIVVPANTPYTRVVISGGLSYDDVNEFNKLFPLFMTYYNKIYADITDTFRQFIPKIMDNIKLLSVTEEGDSLHKKEKIEEQQLSFVKRNSELLQKYAPDLFVANYKRRCRAEWLPSIILPDQISSWISSHPDHYYLPYPPNDTPRFYIVCMQEGRPYVNVKYNLHLTNKETHPYIFCCHPHNRLNDPESRARIEQYLTQMPVPLTINTKASNIIVTQRVLPPGGLAILPYTLTEFFRSYQSQRGDLQFLRYGIAFSPNSFIHAVLTAIQYPEYMILADRDREPYVQGIRSGLTAILPMGLVKQECYDEDEDEIHHYLDQVDLPLDPLKYYRLLEELYGINIYLCGLSEVGMKRTGQEHKSNTGQKVLHNAILQLPRYYQHHYQTRRNRPTIVIYRNFGSEADGIDYVQCELITVYHRDNSNLQLTFSSAFGEYCYDAMLQYHRLISWIAAPNVTPDVAIAPSAPAPNVPVPSTTSTLTTSTQPIEDEKQSVFPYRQYRLWSAYHNWVTFVQQKGLMITNQYIDDYGKLRAIVVSDGTNRGTIITIPDQPLNVNTINLDDLPRFSDEMATTYFSHGGYHSLYDIPQGYYIVTASYPNFLINTAVSPTIRLTALRRMVGLLQQTMLWMYRMLSQQYDRNDLDVVNYFFHEYVHIDDYDGDTYEYYRFNNLPRVFPSDITSLNDVINHVSKYTDRVIVEGKFNCYSQLFARQCYDYLRGYVASNPVLPLFNYYYRYYYSSADYRHRRHVQLFLSSDELEGWLDRQLLHDERYYDLRRVHKTISLYRSYITYPYYFQDTLTNQYYLIQNVSRGSIGTAMSVAGLWLREGLNGGFDYSSTNDDLLSLVSSSSSQHHFPGIPDGINYIIYTITPVGTIIATIVVMDSDTVPLEILCYGDAYSLLRQQPHLVYAAMLPLR